MGSSRTQKRSKKDLFGRENDTGYKHDTNFMNVMGGYGTQAVLAKKGGVVRIKNIINSVKDKKISSFEEYYKLIPEGKNDTVTYNLEEAFKELPLKTMLKFAKDPNAHLPDTYKTVKHPTFSVESKYHSTETPGGNWGGSEGKWTFTPSNINIENFKGKDFSEKLNNYIKWFEKVEPEVTLDLTNLNLDSKIKYRLGGSLDKEDKEEIIEEITEEKKNVIPDGAFHSRLNKIDLEGKEGEITRKGIPVITEEDGKITQHAEVERNEIIFHKEATDIMESLFKKWENAATDKEKDELAIECGKYVTSQILTNTDDRTGIIQNSK